MAKSQWIGKEVIHSMSIYYIGSMPESEYLRHFGIQGMKWGQRRYQNADGTLTSEGKIRYRVASRKERRTLDNLKAMKKDKIRLSRMSYRQRQRLDSDIDFYNKRLKGEVKKKNIISRSIDYKRSKNFKTRVRDEVIRQGVSAVISTAANSTVSKIATGKLNLAVNAGNSFVTAVNYAAGNTVISELYNRAVGRY